MLLQLNYLNTVGDKPQIPIFLSSSDLLGSFDVKTSSPLLEVPFLTTIAVNSTFFNHAFTRQ
jgi:hypothetical protein